MGGIAGLVGGLKQAKAQKKVARRMIASQEKIYEAGEATRRMYGEKVEAQGQIAQEQLRAAEQARFNVTAMLGKPGTYDMPRPAGPFESPLGLGGIYDPGARPGGVLTAAGRTISKTGEVTGEDVKIGGKARYKGTAAWSETGEVLDPNRLTQEIASTAQFRTISRLTAEAEQIANRQGPLWDQLNASVTGGIYEGAAAGQRQMMEQLSREMAKGGSARRQGMAIASAMRMQEDINRTRSSALWQAKSQLESLRTTIISDTQNLTNNWLSNTAGIRDNFTATLTNLQTFWSQVMPANLVGAQAATQQNLANNVMQGDQMMMQAVNTKYQAIIGGTNSIIGGITGSSMVSQITSGIGGGPK